MFVETMSGSVSRYNITYKISERLGSTVVKSSLYDLGVPGSNPGKV